MHKLCQRHSIALQIAFATASPALLAWARLWRCDRVVGGWLQVKRSASKNSCKTKRFRLAIVLSSIQCSSWAIA
ncbi:MAG: hypothetical protein HC852_19945 [Acaryochloridaceae cyanobacterium RU_4_10]|nr:hypothetical protein [Acaryochloridaceae cyanobacterium RU_4_10]